MSSSKPDNQNDILVTIKLDGTRSGFYAGQWFIKKSLLIKHSGFFRAMFSHDWLESNSNAVTLHDDNEHAQSQILSYLSETWHFQWYSGKKWTVEWATELENRHTVTIDYQICSLLEQFKLADKYNILALRDGIWEPMAFYINNMSCGRISQNEQYRVDFLGPNEFMGLARTIINLNGEYPKQLFGAFALAYQAYKLDGLDVPELTAFIGTDVELACYVAEFMCDRLVRVSGASIQQANAVHDVLTAS